jgi:hypothetical protein
MHFVEGLLKTGKHIITAVTRTESKATFPDAVKVARVDYSDEDALISALKGQQFLVITLPGPAPPELHSKLVQAAAKAGVPYIMPNAYGHDILNERLASEDLYGAGCIKRCQEIQDLGMSYIVMTCGFWYEWSVAFGEPAFGIDIKTKKAVFFDDGKTETNTSSWIQCGRALAGLLSLKELPEDENDTSETISNWKNKPMYITSFKTSQRGILDSINRVMGTKDDDWEIEYQNSEERYKKGLEDLKAGNRLGFARAMYTRIFYPNGDGEFETKRELANEMIGLEREDLDVATKRAVDMVESGWSPFH